MRNLLVATLALVPTIAATARAEAPAMHRTVEAMRMADDSVCNLLRAQAADRCSTLLSDQRATIYRSGTAHGITRVVVALPVDGHTLVGPSIDMVGIDPISGATLTAITPVVRDLVVDGKPAIAVEVTAAFGKGADAFQTHDAIACAQAGRTAWKCAHVEAGRCEIAIGDDGKVTSSCGSASLSVR